MQSGERRANIFSGVALKKSSHRGANGSGVVVRNIKANFFGFGPGLWSDPTRPASRNIGSSSSSVGGGDNVITVDFLLTFPSFPSSALPIGGGGENVVTVDSPLTFPPFPSSGNG
nr:hypothetical protein Iba_chr10dCG13670 [Ipomoea batatas]GMD48724.1 hypothetical protein Iba_chr10fCG9120 [Ipomoea batatas]